MARCAAAATKASGRCSPWHSMPRLRRSSSAGSRVDTAHFYATYRRLIRDKGNVMKFKPLHDRLLLKPLAAETKTKAGIIIPDTAQEKPMQGEVVAVGKGKRLEDGRLEPLGVKVGDKVIYGKWSGTEVKLDGVEHVILKEEDLFGVVG